MPQLEIFIWATEKHRGTENLREFFVHHCFSARLGGLFN